jgi:cyclopropane fatty-acyl-phospholipid synthase-like methyltransferase
MAHPHRERSLPRVYWPENSIGEETLYMNCGYWGRGAATYDQACAHLVELIADKAGIQASDAVLDVGFGYGDQIALVARKYRPQRIVGINVSPFQVDTARERLATAGIAGTVVDLRVADAVRTGLPDASFDVILAVECTAHFRTRDAFLAEARRLLRPGGRLAIADVLVPPARGSLVDRVVVRCCRDFWQAPAENLYALDVYRERIAAAGFEGVEAESIRGDVFRPLMAFVRGKVVRRELPRRMDAGLRLAYRALTGLQAAFAYDVPLDYGIAWGRKGAASAGAGDRS